MGFEVAIVLLMVCNFCSHISSVFVGLNSLLFLMILGPVVM